MVSLDEVRQRLGVSPTDDQGQVVQYAKEKCRDFLRSGTSFIFNATNLIRQTRERWISLFADYRARIEIVYVEPSASRLLKQNRDRESSVPEDVVLKLAKRCELPTLMECHDLIVTDGDS